MTEGARHRCHIRAACDHQAGGDVPEGMDVQLLRQAVLLEDQLVPSRFMRKIVCRLRLSEVSRQ